MISSFLTVGQQVLILFILILVGFFSNKTHLLKNETIPGMTDFVLFIVAPCAIINSFLRDFDSSMLANLGKTVLLAFAIMLINILISTVLIHNEDVSKEKVLRFGSIFSNCAYMSLPLQQAILGADGIFYGAAFIGVFNILCWSYGIILMGSNKGHISVQKIIFNPCIISIFLGIICFLCSIHLPVIIKQPIEALAALNTPVPMVIVGFQLANTKLLSVFTEKSQYPAIFIRLILIPAITILLIALLPINKTVATTVTIAASAPTAAVTSMFAIKFQQNTELAVSIISLSTILSLITMPLLVGLAQIL